jgi:hypothetical protein
MMRRSLTATVTITAGFALVGPLLTVGAQTDQVV